MSDTPSPVTEDAAAPQLPSVAEPQTKAAREILALKTGGAVEAIVPKTLEEVFRYAQLVVNAGLAPDSYDTGGRPDPQKICIGILTGSEVGVPPMQALKGIAIINKRPAIYGDLAVALCQSKGAMKSFESNFTGIEDQDDYTCHVVIWRHGHLNPYEGKFSIKDAKRANLWMNTKKRPWVEYPYRMLFNRARAFALRDGFADCLAGLAIVEEVRDLPPEPVALAGDALDDAPALTHEPPTEDPAKA